MAAHRIGEPVESSPPSVAPQDHSWRVVLAVLLALVVVLGVVAVAVVAASSGLVSEVWDAMTSVLHQP
jgi:hypothetical protein